MSATAGTSTFTVSDQATTIASSGQKTVRPGRSRSASPTTIWATTDLCAGQPEHVLGRLDAAHQRRRDPPARQRPRDHHRGAGGHRQRTVRPRPHHIGQAPTDKAGIFFSVNDVTLANHIVFNTVLGNDRPGIRADATGIVLAGTITANLSDASFSTNGTGDFTLTGQVTGPRAVPRQHLRHDDHRDAEQHGNANNYQGNTTLPGSKGVLVLGANNQIPDGEGRDVDNSGTLNLSGLSDTVNGLFGGGTVTNGSSTAATLTVGADARPVPSTDASRTAPRPAPMSST